MNKYIVQPGDTLYLIAKKLLGDGSRYREFLQWNPQITDVNRIDLGDVIMYPSPVAEAKPYVPPSTGVQVPITEPTVAKKPILGVLGYGNRVVIGMALGVATAIALALRKKPRAA